MSKVTIKSLMIENGEHQLLLITLLNDSEEIFRGYSPETIFEMIREWESKRTFVDAKTGERIR